MLQVEQDCLKILQYLADKKIQEVPETDNIFNNPMVTYHMLDKGLMKLTKVDRYGRAIYSPTDLATKILSENKTQIGH